MLEAQVIEVWGDHACFTRPELKVERFSYPVITPSAARGIFDAIYCKPSRDGTSAEFRWQVTQVEVLKLPSYIALRRNEVKNKAPVSAIQKWMSGRVAPEPLLADSAGQDEGRTQRQTMALRDVRYRLHAVPRMWPGHEHRDAAIIAQFRRRASTGKCFYQPCFGCREFPAYFELVEEGASLTPRAPMDLDIGIMLYDVFDLSRPGTDHSKPSISLFRARVVAGLMLVPDYDSPEVLKPRKEAPCSS
jgi:CRISPR-associated protein Cas5d